MRLLLLEDEDAIRSALTRGLRHRGHDVQAAANLHEARALVGDFVPEALVSDLKLPDGNGLDLAEELHVPCVLMTGYGTFDDAVRALRLGCVDFFTKPAPLKELCRALERVASRQQHGPQVLLPRADHVQVVHAHAGNVVCAELRYHHVTWTDAAAAAALFPRLAAWLPTPATRHITAELLQAANVGSLTLNLFPARWSVWLQAQVDWTGQSERQHLIRDLARHHTWSADGALVECAYG